MSKRFGSPEDTEALLTSLEQWLTEEIDKNTTGGPRSSWEMMRISARRDAFKDVLEQLRLNHA